MDELQPLKYMYNTVHMYSNAAGKLWDDLLIKMEKIKVKKMMPILNRTGQDGPNPHVLH
jgi:hypothetical protein